MRRNDVTIHLLSGIVVAHRLVEPRGPGGAEEPGLALPLRFDTGGLLSGPSGYPPPLKAPARAADGSGGERSFSPGFPCAAPMRPSWS